MNACGQSREQLTWTLHVSSIRKNTRQFVSSPSRYGRDPLVLAQVHHEEHDRSAALLGRPLVENAPVLVRVQVRIHGVRHRFVQRQPEHVRLVVGRHAEAAEAHVQDAALVEAERAESDVAPEVVLWFVGALFELSINTKST